MFLYSHKLAHSAPGTIRYKRLANSVAALSWKYPELSD